MYRYLIPTRILFAIGIGLLIFSLVFGWVAFAVPDWIQFYEPGALNNQTSSVDSLNDLKKFGLWYKCIFIVKSNDFACTVWENHTPSFVRVAQVLIPIGLGFSCLSLLIACTAFICTRSFITTVLFAGLFAFLSFVFVIIGAIVFATESVVYVDRLRVENNEHPRRWGMWLLIPSLIFSFFTSICFIIASILNWCDYRSMQVSGFLSDTAEKFNGSVCKLPPDSHTMSALKKQYQQQDYPNACYQLQGGNNNQLNPMGYPPPPNYAGQGYQAPPPGPYGYSRPPSPTTNPMFPYSNFDPYHPRQYMTENSEMDDLPRSSRSRRRSRNRSRSHSPPESTVPTENNQKQTQYIPIPVPYYHPQASQPGPVTTTKTNSQPVSYIIPQAKQQYLDGNNQSSVKATNMLKYGTAQPSVLLSNPTQPAYTIAYRANNAGNVFASNLLTGPAAATYVTATPNQMTDLTSLNSDSDQNDYQAVSKRRKFQKKININQAWAWRKM